MSGLFAELVQRGAGIAPSAGVPLLRLRPRSRFEPVAGLPEADAVMAIEEPPALPSSPAIASTTDGGLDQLARHSAALFTTETLRVPDAMPAPAPAGSPGEIAPPTQTSPPNAPRMASAASHPELLAEAPQPLIPIAPATRSITEQAEEVLRPAETPRAQPIPAPTEATGPAPALALEAPVSSPLPFPPAAADQPASEPVAPQITIAIERIDIAFAPPPAPRSPAPVAIPRSSGFAAYARARRGLPR
jgi:hypothetical protein